jgi:hypothetical protein
MPLKLIYLVKSNKAAVDLAGRAFLLKEAVAMIVMERTIVDAPVFEVKFMIHQTTVLN